MPPSRAPPPLQRPVGQERQRHEDEPGEEDRFREAHVRARPASGCPYAVADRVRGRALRRAKRSRRGAGGEAKMRSQSPPSRARRGRRRRGAARWRTSSRSAAAAAAEAVADPALAGRRRGPGGPVLGSTSQRSPARSPAAARRGSTISTAITPWRARRACSGPFPVAFAAEVGDDHDQGRAGRPSAAALELSAAPSDVVPRLRPRARGAARPAARAGPGGPGAGA